MYVFRRYEGCVDLKNYFSYTGDRQRIEDIAVCSCDCLTDRMVTVSNIVDVVQKLEVSTG